MRKRPLFIYACVFLTGVVCWRFEKPVMILLLFIWLGYEWIRLIPHKKIKLAAGRSVILLSAFVLGNLHMQNEMVFREAYLSKVSDGKTYTVWGEISKIETTSMGSIRLVLSDCFISLNEGEIPCNSIMVYTDSNLFQVGEIYKITGQLHMFEEAANEGGFDSKSFYLSQKIDFCIYEKESLLIADCDSWLKTQVLQFKAKLDKVYENSATKKCAGFLSSMLLGDKTDLDTELKSLFTNGGIAHILAISGLHVSIIGRGLYKKIRNAGISFGVAGLLSGMILYIYCFMSGNGMSAIRAVGMMLIFFVGQFLGKSYDMLNALGAMILFLLWDNPFLLEYSGFWFSILALIGVGFIGSAFSKITERGSGFLMSLGVTLSTLPVVAYCYYEIPLYATFVNFLLLPFLTPLFVFALLGGVIGLLWPSLAYVILLPCEWGVELYEWVCQMVEKLPFSMIITGAPSPTAIIVYYVVLVVGTMRIKYLIKQQKEEKNNRYKIYVLVFFIAIACFGIIAYPKQHQEEIVFLDVGQGDGIYICTGDGVSYFIDGGSSDREKLGEYYILPFLKYNDIEKIDYWFVSHADKDHTSGLIEVMESGYAIKCLVVSDLDGILDENMSSLLDTARKLAVEIIYMEEGDCIKTENTAVTCLYPSEDVLENHSDILKDRNECSLVLQYESKNLKEQEYFKAIFAGDISSKVESILIEEGKLQDVHLYKVSHHGSKYSNALETLRLLSPEVAVVSCGKYNLYGHPAKEVISSLLEVGADIYYTMDVGQITVTVCDGKIIVVGKLSKF